MDMIVKSILDPCGYGATVILSPHSDDAALSLGGIIQKDIIKPPITLLTIFGRSNYLRNTAFQEDWREVTRIRRNEDEAFALAARLQWRFLEMAEAGLRLGPSFEMLFSDQNYSVAPVPAELEAELREVLDELNPRFLFAPIGLGRHHDHLIVREIARKMAEQRGITPIYFEDLPYAAEYSEEEIIAHAREFDTHLQQTCIPITSELHLKLAALRLYQSQIGMEELKAVRDYATRLDNSQAFERLWSPTFPIKLFEGYSL